MSKPTWRERTKPLELLALAGVFALFAGLIVLMSTRQLLLSVIFLGIAFIVSLVVLAMLALAVNPSGEEAIDLAEQDAAQDPTAQGQGDVRRNRGH